MAGKLTHQCGNDGQVLQLNGQVFRFSNWRSDVGKLKYLFTTIQRHPREEDCRKKQKSGEPQRHQGTKEAFLSAGRSLSRPGKTLCLRVFVVPFFSEPVATKAGIHASQQTPAFKLVSKVAMSWSGRQKGGSFLFLIKN